MNIQLETIKEQINKLSSQILEAIDDEISKANEVRDLINATIESRKSFLKGVEETAKQDEEFLLESIAVKKAEFDSLTRKIESLSESKKTVIELEAIIESKKTEAESMKKILTSKTDEFNELQTKLSEGYAKYTRDLEEYNQQIELKQKELDTLRSIAIPTIAQLDARKKELDSREKDLKIVEERLKAVYKKNGLNFRI